MNFCLICKLINFWFFKQLIKLIYTFITTGYNRLSKLKMPGVVGKNNVEVYFCKDKVYRLESKGFYL